jgi:hypothetical protein
MSCSETRVSFVFSPTRQQKEQSATNERGATNDESTSQGIDFWIDRSNELNNINHETAHRKNAAWKSQLATA